MNAEVEVCVGKRRRIAVDYRKLNDEMFGEGEAFDGEAEDERVGGWGPSSPGRIEADAAAKRGGRGEGRSRRRSSAADAESRGAAGGVSAPPRPPRPRGGSGARGSGRARRRRRSFRVRHAPARGFVRVEQVPLARRDGVPRRIHRTDRPSGEGVVPELPATEETQVGGAERDPREIFVNSAASSDDETHDV